MKGDLKQKNQMLAEFESLNYQRINARRLEHLSQLAVVRAGFTVLELGAGPGDLTHYFLDRQCHVLSTDAREECVKSLISRYSNTSKFEALVLDANCDFDLNRQFDLVFSYGLLYHLSNPIDHLRACSRHGRILILETIVSNDIDLSDDLNLCHEDSTNPTQALNSTGCRPNRKLLYKILLDLYPHVYMPCTQPCHEQFPLDWTSFSSNDPSEHSRAVFVASHYDLTDNEMLSGVLTDTYARCK